MGRLREWDFVGLPLSDDEKAAFRKEWIEMLGAMLAERIPMDRLREWDFVGRPLSDDEKAAFRKEWIEMSGALLAEADLDGGDLPVPETFTDALTLFAADPMPFLIFCVPVEPESDEPVIVADEPVIVERGN